MDQDFSHAFHWPPQFEAVDSALRHVFETGEWGKYHGQFCQELIEQLRTLLKLQHVRLCSSGTVAVEIALVAAGIKPGDEVVLAGYDFPGNFRAIESVGATPVLADIDHASWCLNPESVAKVIRPATRAIIVSHLHGGIADVDQIVDCAKNQNILVVEDICQCPGASWHGRPLGSIGDVCALSFGGSKLLSAGRGGAIATNDERILQRAKIFCDRGNDAYPLSELQAAVLIPQLQLLPQLAEKRLASVQRLTELLNEQILLVPPQLQDGCRPDFYKVPLRLTGPKRKQDIINALRSEGITIDHGFKGFVSRSTKRCIKPVDLNHSMAAVEQTLILHHPCLLSDDFEKIVARIRETVESLAG